MSDSEKACDHCGQWFSKGGINSCNWDVRRFCSVSCASRGSSALNFEPNTLTFHTSQQVWKGIPSPYGEGAGLRARKPHRITPDEGAAIDAYLATQTPRKYPENDSADDWNLMLFLIGRGFKVYRNGGKGKSCAPVFINGVKTLRAKFIALVNREREKLGMMLVGVPV